MIYIHCTLVSPESSGPGVQACPAEGAGRDKTKTVPVIIGMRQGLVRVFKAL